MARMPMLVATKVKTEGNRVTVTMKPNFVLRWTWYALGWVRDTYPLFLWPVPVYVVARETVRLSWMRLVGEKRVL